MKKLIAISMMIALVAGAAFAQDLQISGALELRWQVASEFTDDSVTPVAKYIGTNASLGGSKFSLTRASDDGTVGARVTYDIAAILGHFVGDYGTGGQPTFSSPLKKIHNQAFIWWQPIEQLKIQLGKDGDGIFNPTGVTRWGFHEGDPGVTPGEFWDASNYLLGNWAKFGLALTITPMDALTINFALGLPDPFDPTYDMGAYNADPDLNKDPSVKREPEKWENVFKVIQLQVGYNVDGIGQFWATYQGESAGNSIGLSYHTSSLLDGLALEAGFSYNLASGAKDAFKFGIGAHYNAGDWGVKTRLFIDGFDNFALPRWDIMPYYDLGFMTAFLNIGITNLTNSATFVINPYVVKKISMADFRAGLIYDTAGSGSWSFNTGLKFSF